MSSEMLFYIKTPTEYLPVNYYCRSSEMYQAFTDFLPYEDIKPIDNKVICDVRKVISDKISKYTKNIEKYQAAKELVATFNNSVQEKTEVLNDYDETIEELTEYITELNEALSFIGFIESINDNMSWHRDTKDIVYVYGGIDCNPNEKEEE